MSLLQEAFEGAEVGEHGVRVALELRVAHAGPAAQREHDLAGGAVGQDAQRRPRRLVGKPLAEATAWLEQYRDTWEASYERLDQLLVDMQRAPRVSRRKRRNP